MRYKAVFARMIIVPASMLWLAGNVASAQSGSISGNPNPCTITPDISACTSSFLWFSQNTSYVQVWVSGGGSELLFAASGPGNASQDAIWITPPPSYGLFGLYDYSTGSRGALLGSTTVTATIVSTGSGSIAANPNPCVAGQGTCTSVITWSSQGTFYVKVLVSLNGGPDQTFAYTGTGGTYFQDASWILGPGFSYSFRLYDYSSGTQGPLLSSVIVTGTNPLSCLPLGLNATFRRLL